MEGYVFQLNCSNGGVPKRPVPEAQLTTAGLACDRQVHLKFHGGPERALCLYSLENIIKLQDEGHPIYPGSTGENLTIGGIDWKTLAPGSQLAVGEEVIIEVVSYASPCRSIKDSFTSGKFKRISQKVYPGESRLYARVLKAGRLAAGQMVCVLDGEEVW
jgi:MOSC domain-containing protein YiiM